MHIPLDLLRGRLLTVVANKAQQGHVTAGWPAKIRSAPDSYDALFGLAEQVAALPLRDDWPYVEPNELDAIRSECDPSRETDAIGSPTLADCSERVRAGFLGSVCGCLLGKPVEIAPTMQQLRDALEKTGDWPLADYFSEATLDAIGKRHGSWSTCCRGRITRVAPDDDINYTILGMLVLEKSGLEFTKDDLRELWTRNLATDCCWGPERTLIVQSGIYALRTHAREPADYDRWVGILNPNDELCGAAIRADAYGYACPGRPELAAELAWRDASFTHRRTGIYGTMWISAAIACAQVMEDRLAIFDTALKYVPQNSRFHEIVSDCLNIVADASDWLVAYDRMFERYQQHGHCKIYFECGTLINSLKFAADVGDGFCKQVMQGNDTDSFGATAGSILGCYFGAGHTESRWLDVFNDAIHTSLASYHEQRLSAVAESMGRLPALTLDPRRTLDTLDQAIGEDPGSQQ